MSDYERIKQALADMKTQEEIVQDIQNHAATVFYEEILRFGGDDSFSASQASESSQSEVQGPALNLAHFNLLSLTKPEAEQLSWRFASLDVSPEVALKAKEDKIFDPQDWQYMQLNRTMASLNSLRLLCQGDEGAYEQFVQAQPEDRKLSLDSFLQLARPLKLRTMNDEVGYLYLRALKAATLVAMVTLTPQARKRADALLGEDQYPIDSVEFMAHVFKDIHVAKQVFPVIADLFNETDRPYHGLLSGWLQSAFASKRHYRHMLYTECNGNGYVELFNKKQSGELDVSIDGFVFWRDYWTLNVAGFQGQINPKGSLYLDEVTYSNMRHLNDVLESLVDNDIAPNCADELYLSYLRARGISLGLLSEQSPPVEALEDDGTYSLIKDNAKELLLTHMCAMLRLHKPEQVKIVKDCYEQSQIDATRAELVVMGERGFATPTYLPAVFSNMMKELSKHYSQEMGVDGVGTGLVSAFHEIDAQSNLMAESLKELEQARQVFSDKAKSMTQLMALRQTFDVLLPHYVQIMANHYASGNQDHIVSFKALAKKPMLELTEQLKENTHELRIDGDGSVIVASKAPELENQTGLFYSHLPGGEGPSYPPTTQPGQSAKKGPALRKKP